jgi:hypothetical protein
MSFRYMHSDADVEENTLCLLCMKNLAADSMKPSKLKRS